MGKPFPFQMTSRFLDVRRPCLPDFLSEQLRRRASDGDRIDERARVANDAAPTTQGTSLAGSRAEPVTPEGRNMDVASFAAVLSAADCGDECSVLSAATEALTMLAGERGSCILLDGHPRVALATHAPALSNWPLDLARYPEIALALEQRAVVLIEDVREDARLERVRALLPPSLTSVVVVPMLIGNRRLGALMTQSTVRRSATPAQLASLGMLGRM